MTTRACPVVLAAALLLALSAAAPASAQDPETALPPADLEQPAAPDTIIAAAESAGPALGERRRHAGRFGLAAHGVRQIPVYVRREDHRNINDVTAGTWTFDAGARYYVMDALALTLNYLRGGLGITQRQDWRDLYDLTGAEYIALDVISAGFHAYLGSTLFPRSELNPYLLIRVSRADWAFTVDGRGGQPYTILDQPVEGVDIGMGAGFGLEYPLRGGAALEFEWVWHWIHTEDDLVGPQDDIWTNTQFWTVGLGLAWNF